MPTGTILVDAPGPSAAEGAVLYARVSSADQKSAERGPRVAKVVSGVGSGLNGHRKGLLGVLRSPEYGKIVVEHRDRLARFGTEYTEAAVAAQGRCLVVVLVCILGAMIQSPSMAWLWESTWACIRSPWLPDGGRIESPRPLAASPRRLRHRQRLHSRKQRGSHNRRKSASGLTRMHRRIPLSAHGLPAQGDHGPGKNQVGHRGPRPVRARHDPQPASGPLQRGAWLVVAPRFYPSSKTCSARGYIKAEIPLGERVL